MITLRAEIFTSITSGEPFCKIDEKNIISIDCPTRDRAEIISPSWGIIANSGSIEFNDVFYDDNGNTVRHIDQFVNLFQQYGTLVVRIYLENTLLPRRELKATLFTEDWGYNDKNHTINLSLTDGLEEMQEITIPDIVYDPRYPYSDETKGNFTYEAVYRKLYALTPAKFRMLAFESLDYDTRARMSNYYLKYPYMNSSSLWKAWDKLGKACQLHIYRTSDGNTTCYWGGGN